MMIAWMIVWGMFKSLFLAMVLFIGWVNLFEIFDRKDK